MIKNPPKIYLASKSPRRKLLLNQINIIFESFCVDLDEVFFDKELPVDTVKRLAEEKMFEARKLKNDGVIITADTIVVLDGERIGKPASKEEAYKILSKLSGKEHYVYTGFSIYNPFKDKFITDYEKTRVKFRFLDISEIEDYVAGGSPMDKAGAYGIQDDFGAVFVEKISGCYYNVVGLPISRVYARLKEIIEDC